MGLGDAVIRHAHRKLHLTSPHAPLFAACVFSTMRLADAVIRHAHRKLHLTSPHAPLFAACVFSTMRLADAVIRPVSRQQVMRPPAHTVEDNNLVGGGAAGACARACLCAVLRAAHACVVALLCAVITANSTSPHRCSPKNPTSPHLTPPLSAACVFSTTGLADAVIRPVSRQQVIRPPAHSV